GITTSASGMLVDERIQELLANNLANSQTTGFKASFAEQMAYPTQQIELSDYNTGGVSRQIGTMGTGVLFQEGVPLFSQGLIQSTGRSLDVAIQDNLPPGTYAAVQAGPGGAGAAAPAVRVAGGTIAVGAGGRLEVGGQPLAVLNASGAALPNVYAVRNPAYTGTQLVGADGKPVVDASGNLSYFFANAQGTVIGSSANPAWQGAALLVGNADDVGPHSFFPVAVQQPDGTEGLALTRDGHFSQDANGILRDAAGNPVLPIGANGQPMTGDRIRLNPAYQGQTLFNANGSAAIDSNGQPSYEIVNAAGAVVGGGRLGTVNVEPRLLQPLGQTEYQVGGSLNAQTVLARLQPGTGSLVIGSLEESNVDVTRVMVQMMAAVQNYTANQHALSMQDAEVEKAVTDVGKVNI
ncbi:MAG: hypothetical protein K6T30_10290, partial [Alicyclobacillus sp.]|nr:hypothetical protein [Alicyclobacillus sp.]